MVGANQWCSHNNIRRNGGGMFPGAVRPDVAIRGFRRRLNEKHAASNEKQALMDISALYGTMEFNFCAILELID